MRGWPWALCALACAAPAWADGLADVRQALQAMGGRSPVTAILEHQVTHEQKDRPTTHGSATVTVSASGDELRIDFPADGLVKARAELAEPDPEKLTPASDGLRSVDPVDVAVLLGYSQRLLAHLQRATLVKESEADYQGAPARLLEFELTPKLSTADRKHVKEASETMKLWCASDGTPLGFERQVQYRGSFFFIRFEGHASFKTRFARVGDRLIAVSNEAREGGSGFTYFSDTTTTTTVKPVLGK